MIIPVRRQPRWALRCVSSYKVLLIIAWCFLTAFSLRCMELKDDYQRESFPEGIYEFNAVILYTAYAISSPAASLIAELLICRLRLVRYCLKAWWLVSIVGSLISLIDYFQIIDIKTLQMTIHYLLMISATVLQGAFETLMVPLALDQISGASNTSISAVVVWMVWALFTGYATGDILTSIIYRCSNSLETKEIDLVVSLVPVLMLSMALLLDIIFHLKLIQEPVTANPVKLIFRVMKYAAQHKYPVQRSAFTYCENEKPTRLDNCKAKYGGPFTTEQVEDVKTFWRMLLVVAVISMLYAPLDAMRVTYSFLLRHFRPVFHSICTRTVLKQFFASVTFLTYAVPMFELLIYPIIRNRGLTILHSAGIGAIILFLSSISGTMVEVTYQLTTNTTVCIFHNPPSEEFQSTVNPYIVIPFSLLLGVGIMLVYKSRIEFVCAQAPYYMVGLLIGLTFMLQVCFRAIGAILRIIWNKTEALQMRLCGIWFYVTNLTMILVITVILFWVIKRYKARERDEISGSQIMVEEVYYKYSSAIQ